MQHSKYRIGVIGAGARGESFARQLHHGMPDAELFGICDKDEDRLGKFVEFCGLQGARTFTDSDEFLGQADLDAVIITTPDFTHKQVTLQTIAAGKHFYIEKPLAPTSEECREMIQAQQASKVACFVGFNMRAVAVQAKLKELVDSGLLGQIMHIEGLEQLSQAHSASFMRRFHRKRSNTGGILNHKCSHDLDLMQWFIGHQHKVTRVASFGGLNVFTPQKAPAKYCHACPREIYEECPYRDQAGFVFPVRGSDLPIHHQDRATYGGDLCVYNDDKEIVDNQTVIMEWDHGVRGNFNLQLCQARGMRETHIWGDKGRIDRHGDTITITLSDTGETIVHTVCAGKGGHGGSDPKMIRNFVDTIEGRGPADSGLAAGLAATLVAEKAVQSVARGEVMKIDPSEFA